MSLSKLYKPAARMMLLAVLLLTVLAVLTPVGISNAQGPDPYDIVRNDGVVFELQDSGKSLSPSYTPPIAPEALVNENVGIKDLKPLGDTSPESVIGPDGRTQITNTTKYPNGAIAHLEVYFPSTPAHAPAFSFQKTGSPPQHIAYMTP